ncbi:polycystic kidney disease protein 1-like 1 isoform X1 [Bufo bufo]|uniref:polycystic kidney disease protein 1-like 1 isoform X1 n=2 Tax=Bufo bufo TaxID=8384 RepID=UPI001ABE9BB8|nr:polycystic kidney disease protein 1-like 1 isoform X1 [Bufo bufo]
MAVARFQQRGTRDVHFLLFHLLLCVVPWSSQTDLWYIGCYNRSLLSFQEKGYRTLFLHQGDLPACSKFCLQNKFDLTIRIDEIDCMCANMSIFDESFYGSVISRVNATKINGTWKSPERKCAPRCAELMCLPHGDGNETLAIFTSAGPYISDVSMRFRNDQIQIGKTIILQISGYLSASLERITGVQNLNIENLTTVTVTVHWSKHNTSSCVAHVGHNGYFETTFSFMYSDPGKHSIEAHVNNIISEQGCEIDVEILNKVPWSLGIRSIEEPQTSSSTNDLGAVNSIMIAFQNTPHQFHAFVLCGSDLNFPWHFMDDNYTSTQNQTEISCDVNDTFTNEDAHEENANVYMTTVGQITITLPDDASITLKTSIKLTLESGRTLYIEMLVNDKITVQNLICFPDNAVKAHNFTMTGDLEAPVIISLEESKRSLQLYATDVDELYASINILHQPTLGEEVILVARINGQVSWDKDYVYTWTFENNVSYSSGSPLITVTCTKLGLHLVRLTVTNYVTTINCYIEYYVVKEECVPRFSHPSNALLEEPILFLLKPPLGPALQQDERITFHFGDNTSICLTGPYLEKYGINFTHSYKKAGLYNPTLIMEKTEIELSSLLLIKISLQRLILYGSTIHRLSRDVPSLLTYIARTNSDSNGIYRWFFSDGKINKTIISKPKLTLDIEAPCSLTVKIEVENHAGCLSASMKTVVQYPIFDVTVTLQEAFVGHFTRFIVTVEPFQQYAVLMNFGDGESIQVQSQEMAKGCLDKQHFCSVFIHLHRYSHMAVYNVSVEVSNLVSTVRKKAEAMIEEAIEIILFTPPIIKVGDFINATLSLNSRALYLWTVYSPLNNHSLLGSSLSVITNVSGTHYITASGNSSPWTQSPGKHIKVLDAIDNVTVFIATGIDYANLVENANGSYSTELIEFKALTDTEANFIFDFGDGTHIVPVNGSVEESGYGASAFHRYSKAGDYIIKVMAYNELFNATDEIASYCVLEAPAGLSIVMNSNSVYKDDTILFSATLSRGTNVLYLWNLGDQTTYNKGPEINATFSRISFYNLTVTACNKVGIQKAWKVVNVLPRKKSIYIYTNGTIFSTETYITFTAKIEETGPLEFIWHFGDRSPERTVRRTITKRFTVPNRYDVTVKASNQRISFTSDTHTIFVQRKVIPNRLVASSSVLMNSSSNFNCRINSGTNVSYFWNFGDGIERLGNNNDTHVYIREGEYTVKVLVFNNVSSAFLTKQIFVVKEHCQPPPVKNMGPPKIQIRRNEELHLGVTFEAGILCNISLGLYYLWSFVKSNGAVIPLTPHIDNRKQTITLPAFSLDYGNYIALARVQIVGTVVYSNYTVPVEVQPSDPVSVIANGHHFFIDKTTVKYFTLNGTPSFDPDNPGAYLRFHWDCTAVSIQEHLCFDSNVPNPLHENNDSVITFPTALLNDRCDQFHFTLTVSNGDRKSLKAETFVSISPNTNFRSVHMTCIECRGLSINWNQQFSVQAVCADCGDANDISYQWNLYWINATESSSTDVPFCRLKESMGAPSALSENVLYNGTSKKVPTLQITSTTVSPASFTSSTVSPASVYTEKQVAEHLFESADSQRRVYGNAENTESSHDFYSMEFSESYVDILDEGSPGDRDVSRVSTMDISSDSDLNYKELHTYESSGFISGDGEGGNLLLNATKGQTSNDFFTHFYGNIMEGMGGSGTRTDSESDVAYGFSNEYTAGDNFVDLLFPAPNISPMINWLKLPISHDIFSSYTTSGISSQIIKLRPFILKPSKMYMLDVTLESRGHKMGRSQLYFTVNEMSHKMTCQVQPKSGIEVFTVFSIFCTSGKEDLNYEFSYQVGELSRKTLYKGRDIQYYFNLPSGDPSSGYQVTVFTQITNIYGSQTQQCPVNVSVLPIVFSNTSDNLLPQLELFQESLTNLSTLVLMGNHIEIRNYVVLLTTVLNRLYEENSKMAFELQSKIRNKLIFVVEGLSFSNQDELNDIVSMLRDLLNTTNQVTAESAMLIMNYTRSIVKKKFEHTEPGSAEEPVVQKKLVENIIFLISSAMEIYSRCPELKTLFEDGLECISDLVVKFITLNYERHFTINTHFLELQTSVHENVVNNIQKIGSSTFYLPEIRDSQNRKQNTSMKCYISQLKSFKKNPYFWAKLSSEVNGDFTSLSLFDCTTRKKMSARDIITPVTIGIGNKHQSVNFNKTQYTLSRDKINFHRLNMISDNKQSALKITVSFSKPQTRTFPVMLLIGHSKKPSPSSFNIKQIHSFNELSTQVFIPVDSLRDAEYSYMALMDADYKRHPKNKYISNMINYTVDVQWTQCLYWHNKQWNSEDCSPQKGTKTSVFTCSCARLGLYTTANRHASSHFSMEDISQFLSTSKNVVPTIVVVICTLLYIVLMFFGKIKDQHEDQKDGFVFLQDNSPNDQQQYAIMVDVGFRSRPKTTAKVHIILHGEDGVSETRELYCPDKPLFERNSRHIFIMSVSESLGPLWKIHIWHNNNGYSPSLYLSHVIVKDLQSGTIWFFYAECWLAIDEGDGKVERELTSVGYGLGFRRLFYCKFTEYLEDFHFWGSVFSQPSYSWFSNTQRITTCFVLLLGYMCLNALLIHLEEDQYTVEIGLIEISTISMACGLKVTLAVYPVIVVLSLLFRFSQKKFTKDSGENQFKMVKGSQIDTTEGHQVSISAADTMFESNWQHFQYWAYDAWKKKYERDFSTSSINFGNGSRRYKSECPSVTTESSSGFEDCNSNNGDKTGLKEFKDCENSSCSQYSSDHSLFGNSVLHGNKVLPPWCVYVAWTMCATFSLTFMTIIVVFGLRFGPTKCVLWLHAVFFSLIYCIFIIQPCVILLIALFVAWHKRGKADFLKALNEDVKYIVGESCLSLKNLRAYSRQTSHETSNFEKILAARKRARYLRLARPPTPAQLKLSKEKLRRRTIIGKLFRELAVYIIMASMLIFIIIEKYSHNEYYVNYSVRNEFTRNAKQLFSEIKTEDHWWNYCFNVLLDGLYSNRWYLEEASHNKGGPIDGKFYIIGAPVMRKVDIANYSVCMISSLSRSDISDCTLPYLSNDSKEICDTMKIQHNKLQQCGKIHCYEERGPVISLGRSRTEAYSALWNIRNQQWIDRRTRAFVVKFLLYNPPTNLFTMVSLLIELPFSGDIITSTHIDSVRIYQITALMDYFIMAFELMYLGMILIIFYLQMNIMIQRGIRNYWQEPWNWVEASIIVLSLCYYICQIFHFMLTVDIMDHLQRGFFKVFIDVSFIVAVEKWTRCLHGTILFLMILKFTKLLRFYKMMSPCVAVFQHSCARSVFIVLIGIVFTMAYSSLGYIIFSSESYSFCSVLNSIQTIFIHLLGVPGTKHIKLLQNQIKYNNISKTCFYGALFIAFTILWTGMLKGILTSVAKCSKKAQRSKHLVTFKELVGHARRLVLSIIGRQKQKSTDGICVTGSNYYLDEFEDLIDELLFRLNAISNSLHHSLPAKSLCYTEEGDMNHLDTSSNFSFKQTVTETEECPPKEKLKEDFMMVQSKLHRACSLVPGINLNCLPQQQGLENACRNGVPEDDLAKPKYSEDNMDHTLHNKQCFEDGHGPSAGNEKLCLDASQHGNAPKYNDKKAILPPLFYIHPCHNAVDIEYNKTDSGNRCTSANIQNRNYRPLRRSHTTVIEPLHSGSTGICRKTNRYGNKVSGNLNNEVSEQPLCNIFHQRFCDIINVKESSQTYVETGSQQQNLNNGIQRDDMNPLDTNACVIPGSVKQCW